MENLSLSFEDLKKEQQVLRNKRAILKSRLSYDLNWFKQNMHVKATKANVNIVKTRIANTKSELKYIKNRLAFLNEQTERVVYGFDEVSQQLQPELPKLSSLNISIKNMSKNNLSLYKRTWQPRKPLNQSRFYDDTK